MTVRAYEWKVENATTPKVVPGHVSRWQQMVQTVTRFGYSVKQSGAQKISSDLQCS